MPTSSPLFDINLLNTEQQNKFHTVYNELNERHQSYLQYKRDLQRTTEFNIEEEENEWRYEIHRYLRARKWDVENTIKSIRNMIEWRIENQIDLILEHQPTINRLTHLRQLIPGVNHGFTKSHRPLSIEKSGRMNVDRILKEITPEELIQCHIYDIEFNCQRARERSQQMGIHLETFAIINDLKGCHMGLTRLFTMLKKSIYIDDNYYPERLGQMFVVNSPTVFTFLWNMVKSWIDPVTKEKIIFIGNSSEVSARTLLLEYIDSDQLPIEYGGSCHSCSTSPDCVPVL